MATIKYYLDKRRPKSDGTAQIKLSVSNGDRQLIGTGLYIHPDYWNSTKNWPKASYRHTARLGSQLHHIMGLAVDASLELPPSANAKTIAERIKSLLTPQDNAEGELKLLDVVDRFCKLKSERSTRLTYMRTRKYIEDYDPEATLDSVSRVWLEGFNLHMAKTSPSPNGRAIHMRNLRAVFNFAIDEELTANYPFRKFKIKTVATEKRAVSPAVLRRVFEWDVEEWQRPYRDFFELSFLLIGINAKDLLYLRPCDLRDGRLVFNRAKTKRLYSIMVQPEAMEIIERYRGQEHLLKFMDKRADYLQFIRQCNHALKTIGKTRQQGKRPEGEPIDNKLTTYVARHSWATIAAALDIPKETISAALGHGSNTVTDIYIDFDRRKVDRANRMVIDAVLSANLEL